MKLLNYLLIGSLAAVPGFAGSAEKAEASFRALTVDIEKAYQNFYKAKDAQAEFEKTVEAARTEVTHMEEEFSKLYEEAQNVHNKAQNPALAEDAKKKLEAEAKEKEEGLRKKSMEMEQYKEDTGSRLRQKNQEIVAKYVDELKVIVAKIAQEKKANMVFNSNGLNVLYAPAEMDVTQELIDRSNADQPKTEKTDKKNEKPAKEDKKPAKK